MATPRAQAELEEFRSLFGRPAQLTLLYHWARLIEDVYAYEHAIEILENPGITDPNIRAKVEPKAGRGVGCVEAPRGTLIHDYSTDDNGLITRANLIVGTTHNLGPMHMSVNQAAKALIHDGRSTRGYSTRLRWRSAPTTPEFPAQPIAWMAITGISVAVIDSNGELIAKDAPINPDSMAGLDPKSRSRGA